MHLANNDILSFLFNFFPTYMLEVCLHRQGKQQPKDAARKRNENKAEKRVEKAAFKIDSACRSPSALSMKWRLPCRLLSETHSEQTALLASLALFALCALLAFSRFFFASEAPSRALSRKGTYVRSIWLAEKNISRANCSDFLKEYFTLQP